MMKIICVYMYVERKIGKETDMFLIINHEHIDSQGWVIAFLYLLLLLLLLSQFSREPILNQLQWLFCITLYHEVLKLPLFFLVFSLFALPGLQDQDRKRPEEVEVWLGYWGALPFPDGSAPGSWAHQEC